MSSEPEATELSSFFEGLVRPRTLSLFFPFILGFPNTTAGTTMRESTNEEDPDQETQQTATPGERIILANPLTQGMVVIEGAVNFESLLRDLAAKNGQPPASKASIEALPSVDIGDGDADEDGECAICLEEWQLGRVVKEMPCKHRFHVNCIDKWLGMHGSCPVCRYKMPVDEEGLGKERRRVEREIWVSFSLNDNRRSGDSNQSPSSDSNDASSSSRRPAHEVEG